MSKGGFSDRKVAKLMRVGSRRRQANSPATQDFMVLDIAADGRDAESAKEDGPGEQTVSQGRRGENPEGKP